MNTPDPIRAALERLVELDQMFEGIDGAPIDDWIGAMTAARAALKAAPEREPSDEELRDLWVWSSGQDQGPWPTQYHCFARAIFARWGRPSAPPAPLEGEVGRLVEWLNAEADLRRNVLSTPVGLNLAQAARQADKLQSWANLIEAQAAAPPAPVEGEAEELAKWLYCLADERTCNRRRGIRPHPSALTRAATLLEQLAAAHPERLHACPTHGQQPANAWGCPECVRELRQQLSAAAPAVVPVAVAERPWEREGWCDAEKQCWIGRPEFEYPLGDTGDFDSIYASWSLELPPSDPVLRRMQHVVSLPHGAIPVPQPPHGEEVE